MTKRLILSTIVVCLVGGSSAQKLVAEVDLERHNVNRNTELFFFENKDRPGQGMLIVNGDENVFPFYVEENSQFQSLQPAQIPGWGEHQNLLGGFYSQNKSTLIYSNGAQKRFASVTIDHENNNVKKNFIVLNKNEFYLESFALGASFYIITTTWGKSALNFYKVSGDKNFEFHEINLSAVKLRKSSLFEVLFERSDNKKDADFSKIPYESINGLSVTFSRNKVYYFDNHCIVTLDYDGWRTHILRIDLTNWQFDLDRIGLVNSKKTIKSNSFLLRDKLFRSVLTDDSLHISVYDLQTKKQKASFGASVDREINFKNGSIVQRRGEEEKMIDNTRALFRRIASSEMAIAVNEFIDVDSLLVLTVGSSYEQDEVIVPSSLPNSTTSIKMAKPIIYNITYRGYKAYTELNSVFFQSKLSRDLDHVVGQIEDNVFDRLRKSLTGDILMFSNIGLSTKDVLFQSLFNCNGKFYAALYDKSQEKLIIFEP